MKQLPVYLASQSPRRRELLAQIGVRFDVLDVLVPEEHQLDEAPSDYVQRVAIDKAQAGVALLEKNYLEVNKTGLSNWQSTKKRATIGLVIGADTAVVCNGQILGKPESAEHAELILKQLSAKTHEVYTGVAVYGSRILTATSRTLVTFKRLSPEEIKRYIATNEASDKAGSYAVQGLAAIFIENLQGSYSGVMGLPLYETARLLAQSGVDVLSAR
ncbi:Septum formation protein Maf [hydrothermal vent metagenome]|uniref:Septum formation protein Maf n=1 Tax=hydrothermal vent metagenome TaxID=652676 RepID=A0A3B1AF63_9ZZZZ